MRTRILKATKHKKQPPINYTSAALLLQAQFLFLWSSAGNGSFSSFSKLEIWTSPAKTRWQTHHIDDDGDDVLNFVLVPKQLEEVTFLPSTSPLHLSQSHWHARVYGEGWHVAIDSTRKEEIVGARDPEILRAQEMYDFSKIPTTARTMLMKRSLFHIQTRTASFWLYKIVYGLTIVPLSP